MRNLSFIDQALIFTPVLLGIFLPSPAFWYAQHLGVITDQLSRTFLDSFLSFLPFLLLSLAIAAATFYTYPVKARLFLLTGGLVGLLSILFPGGQALGTIEPEAQKLALILLPIMAIIAMGLGLLVAWIIIRYFWLPK